MIANLQLHGKEIFCRKAFTIGSILGLALILRLIGISSKSLWLDECYSLLRISGTWVNSIAQIAMQDAHPPLYYLLLKFWWGLHPHGEYWARIPTIILDVLSIFFIYRALDLFSIKRAAYVGAFLAACSAFMIVYAQDARHYSLTVCLSALLTWGLLGILLRGTKKYVYIYFIGTLLALYTFYYLAFLLLVYGIILTAEAIRQTDFRVKFRHWFFSQIAALLAFLPWAWQVIPEKIDLFQGTTIPAGNLHTRDLWELYCSFLIGEKQILGWAVALLIGVGLLAQLGWSYHKQKGPRKYIPVILTLSICAVVLILVLFPLKGHMFQSKHLIFLAPLVWITIAATSTHRYSWILIIIIAVANLVSLARYYPNEKQAWQGAAAYIYERIREGEVVCFNPFYLKIPFEYYYARQGQSNFQGKRFVPGYTYDSRGGGGQIPAFRYGHFYFRRQDLEVTGKRDFWLIEVRGCRVAPPEPRMQAWCQKIYPLRKQHCLTGHMGDIIITYYSHR